MQPNDDESWPHTRLRTLRCSQLLLEINTLKYRRPGMSKLVNFTKERTLNDKMNSSNLSADLLSKLLNTNKREKSSKPLESKYLVFVMVFSQDNPCESFEGPDQLFEQVLKRELRQCIPDTIHKLFTEHQNLQKYLSEKYRSKSYSQIYLLYFPINLEIGLEQLRQKLWRLSQFYELEELMMQRGEFDGNYPDAETEKDLILCLRIKNRQIKNEEQKISVLHWRISDMIVRRYESSSVKNWLKQAHHPED